MSTTWKQNRVKCNASISSCADTVFAATAVSFHEEVHGEDSCYFIHVATRSKRGQQLRTNQDGFMLFSQLSNQKCRKKAYAALWRR